MKWWFSYLEKLVRKLFNCCHVTCGEKKVLDYLSVDNRGKRNRTKSLDYNCICLAVYLLFYFVNYLFLYLLYLLFIICVYLCIYLFHLSVYLRDSGTGRGAFLSKREQSD